MQYPGTAHFEQDRGRSNLTVEARSTQPGEAGNPKSEARNPKQIQIHGNEGMEKRGVAELRRSLRAIWTIAVQRKDSGWKSLRPSRLGGFLGLGYWLLRRPAPRR